MHGLWAPLVLAAAPALSSPLTEDQAVELALRNSPQVKFRGHFFEEAKARTDADLHWNNPQLRISDMRYGQLVDPAIDRRTYGDHPFYHTEIAIRWRPPELGERGALRAEGRVREADRRLDLAETIRETRAFVRQLHARILTYDAQIALGKETVEQTAKLNDLVKRKREQHAATLLEQSIFDVEHLDAANHLAEAEVRRRAAYNQLLAQLGLPAGAEIALAPSTKDPCAPPAETAALIERAKATNPRLDLYRAEIERADAARKKGWLDLIPWFDFLQVSYGLAGDNNPSYVAFNLALTLPILDWKRADRRAAATRRDGFLERIKADERALSDLVIQTAAEQAEQAVLVKRYRESVAVMEDAVEKFRASLERGHATDLFEVVKIESRLQTTRRYYLRAQLECKLQQIELERLSSETSASP
jgi:outer membrane protein TolC